MTNHARLEKHRLAIVIVSDGTTAVLSYLACALQDVTIMPLPEQLGDDQLVQFIKLFEPDYIIMRMDRDDPPTFKGYQPLEAQLFQKNLKIYHCQASNQQDITEVVLLLSTSGSTGDPKVVKLSNKNLAANAESISRSLLLDSKDIAITTLPLNYSFGISVINSHIFVGGKIACTDSSIVEKSFWTVFNDNHVTCIYGVPYQFEILKKFRVFSRDLSGLRFFAQAGGALNKDIKEWFYERCLSEGKAFFTMYGQTECAPRISSFNLVENLSKIDSVGTPIECCTVSIDADVGLPGEVLVKGQSVFSGYARHRKDITEGNDPVSTHRTGDLGYLDEDGFLYITGRLKRFVKIYGHNVNLDHLENSLCRHYSDLAVVGCENKLGIYIQGSEADAKKISTFVQTSLALNVQSIYISLIDEIPRLSSGKINYKDLLGRLEN